MAVKQLHLNDVSKTPIEPVISTGSIPNGAVTEEKLANNLFTPLGNPKKPEAKPEYVMFDENLDGFKVSLDYSKIEYDKTGEYPEPDFDGLTTVGYVQAKLDKKQNILTAGSITSDLIADGAVTKSKIAPKAITANEIADGTISTAQLDSQVVSNINNADTIANSAKALAEANKAKLDKINTDLLVVVSDVQNIQDEVKTKQANLVSGTNIKTVNGNSLLGAGDISISGSGGSSAPSISSITLNSSDSRITTISFNILGINSKVELIRYLEDSYNNEQSLCLPCTVQLPTTGFVAGLYQSNPDNPGLWVFNINDIHFIDTTIGDWS